MERNVWGNKRNIWGADVGEPIQVDELPTASIDELGNIYQYVGTTDANYTNGYFYQCVSDGQTPPTYSWQRKNVQPNSGGVWGSITGTLSNQTDLNTQLTAIKAKTDQKADIVHIETPATAADYEIGYDEVINLGTLTGSITLTLEAIAQGDTAAHVYHIIFTADTTAPTITWPEGITWAGGSAPTITASKTYEISIFHNLAIGKEY